MLEGGSLRSGKYGLIRTLIIKTPKTQVITNPVKKTPCLSRGQRFLWGSKKTGTSRILRIYSIDLEAAVQPARRSTLGAQSEVRLGKSVGFDSFLRCLPKFPGINRVQSFIIHP